VRLLGHLDRAALRDAMARTRIVVSCSRWFEGFPNAVLEAMAAGKPVLATDLGGMAEIVNHDRTGLLYHPGDLDEARGHLEGLYGDVARCQGYGAAAHRKVVATYGAEQVFAAYERVFRLARQSLATSDEAEPDCESVAVPLG
jgi:glycosyltransferase involved in cell wall biosynthesis